MTQADSRYPSSFTAEGETKVNAAHYRGHDTVTVSICLENKPGGSWVAAELPFDEAEQFALHILKKIKAARSAQSKGHNHE